METKKEQRERLPLVLFSGGLDSTYQLYKLLQESDCDVLYIDGGQGDDKVNAEWEARQHILTYLNKNSPNMIRNQYRTKISLEYTVNSGIKQFNVGLDTKFAQPANWLHGALLVSNAKIHDSLYIAYVAGDQMLAHLSHVESAWHFLQMFTKDSEPIPVTFSLKYHKKREIIAKLPPALITLTWCCELPVKKILDQATLESKYTPCCQCSACLNQIEAFTTTEYKTYEGLLDWIKYTDALALDGSPKVESVKEEPEKI